MPNTGIQDILYSKGKDPLEFRYDNIEPAPPILSFMTLQDIKILNDTAKSLKYSGNIQKKYDIIDKIMTNRGFVKFHSGTNRVVYRPLEAYHFVVKIALDRVGLTDSPREFKNQVLLQPFCTKVFECTPCGTVATFERVKPIIRKEEFISIAEDVFDLLNKKILGKYILDDIGADYYMNWAIRTGFGVVLLDFPYIYELDGAKLMCTKTIPELNNQRCTGVIDYDVGFNNLVCNECGKKYNALDLEKEGSDIEIVKGGDVNMKVIIRKGNEVIQKNEGTDSIKRSSKRETVNTNSTIKVLFKGIERDVSVEERPDSKGGMNTHEDIMKARKEIMDRQRREYMVDPDESSIGKNHDIFIGGVKMKMEEDDVQRVLSSKAKGDPIPRDIVEKYNIDIPEEEVITIDKDNDGDEEVATIDEDDDLTNIDVLEEKYGYLEDEFEDGTYEKITKETKKFY